MKVAFLISGRSRNYIYQAQTFYDKVFKLVDADIYISFQENSRLFNDPEEVCKKIPIHLRIDINDKIDDKEFLTKLFGDRLKYFGYDKEDYIQEIVNRRLDQIKLTLKESKEDIDYQRIYYTLDQYTRVKNIAEIFESNKKIDYDIVVRLRLDQLFWIDEYNIISSVKDKNKLHFSFREEWEKSQNNNIPNWIQDYFFFGNQEKMIYVMKNIVENVYKNPDYLIKNSLNILPETQVSTFINTDNNIKNNLEKIQILSQNFLNIGMYRTGYYLGKKENIAKCIKWRG